MWSATEERTHYNITEKIPSSVTGATLRLTWDFLYINIREELINLIARMRLILPRFSLWRADRKCRHRLSILSVSRPANNGTLQARHPEACRGTREKSCQALDLLPRRSLWATYVVVAPSRDHHRHCCFDLNLIPQDMPHVGLSWTNVAEFAANVVVAIVGIYPTVYNCITTETSPLLFVSN